MSTESKAPTDQSTSPLGNFRDEKPTPLARGISPTAAAKLKDHPHQRKHIDDIVARKRAGQDGHTRK